MTESRTDSRIRELFRQIEDRTSHGSYIYRGEAKYFDKISSTLYREYRKLDQDFEERIVGETFDIEIAQRGMLEDVQRYTNFTDEADILVELQHYGGNTNLIDFSTDYRIAIFFSCDSRFDEDGRIILLNQGGHAATVFEPPKNKNNRVISQKSVFVRPSRGYLEEHSGNCVLVTIDKELKQPILNYLRRYHGISTETMYSDIFGYIQNQSKHSSAYMEFYHGLTCISKGTTEEIIEHFSNAIMLDPSLTKAYIHRGAAYARKGDHERAVEDYDRAIALNPALALAWYGRALCRLFQKDWNQARADITAARGAGADIITLFQSEYGNVSGFEKKHIISLPNTITELLGG